MLIGALFWLLTIVGCAYATLLGGRDGRWATLLIISASLLTIPAGRLGNAWITTEYRVFLVDLALLVGLYTLALRGRSYFPIWMAGFHLVAVISHLSTLMAPDFTPQIYRALGSVWAIPMTISMMWGIHLDRRAQSAGADLAGP